MALLGMLAMGIFVGLVACQGTAFVGSVESWQKVMVEILGACFGGVVVTYMGKQMQSAGNAVYMYPVGLLLSYSWLKTAKLAPMMIYHSGEFQFYLGLAGLLGVVVLSLVAFVFVLPSAARDAGLWKK
jgi:hypothetical protein